MLFLHLLCSYWDLPNDPGLSWDNTQGISFVIVVGYMEIRHEE